MVRTNQRWDAGVGAGGGNPGRIARVWPSLDINMLVDVEPAERGQHDTIRRIVATGGAARFGNGGPKGEQPPENSVRRV
jgi:hypothetical protein